MKGSEAHESHLLCESLSLRTLRDPILQGESVKVSKGEQGGMAG